MSVPEGARFEAEPAGGVAIWDVAHLLPTTRGGYPRRDPASIDRAFVHHSGARGRTGFAGMLGSARYSTRRIVKDGRVVKTAWPGFAYHLWIQDGGPDEVDRDDEGRLVIYRGNADDRRSYHTGGEANDRGIGVVLQGNTTARPLSWSHVESLEALLPWLAERHALRMPYALGWHSIAGGMGGDPKAACPGQSAEAWLMGYVRGLVRPAPLDLRPA